MSEKRLSCSFKISAPLYKDQESSYSLKTIQLIPSWNSTKTFLLTVNWGTPKITSLNPGIHFLHPQIDIWPITHQNQFNSSDLKKKKNEGITPQNWNSAKTFRTTVNWDMPKTTSLKSSRSLFASPDSNLINFQPKTVQSMKLKERKKKKQRGFFCHELEFRQNIPTNGELGRAQNQIFKVPTFSFCKPPDSNTSNFQPKSIQFTRLGIKKWGFPNLGITGWEGEAALNKRRRIPLTGRSELIGDDVEVRRGGAVAEANDGEDLAVGLKVLPRAGRRSANHVLEAEASGIPRLVGKGALLVLRVEGADRRELDPAVTDQHWYVLPQLRLRDGSDREDTDPNYAPAFHAHVRLHCCRFVSYRIVSYRF